MLDDSVTVKGTPVRSLQKFVEAELTAEEREAALRNLPPEYAVRFRTPVHLTETVPVHMLNRFTEEAAKARGEDIQAFAIRAGREAADEAVRGVYRFFVKVLTPAALLSKTSQMWSSLYNRGDLRVVEQTENSARIRLEDFHAEIAGCARVTGWIERMAELTGAHRIAVSQTACSAHEDACCEWTVEWE
jgi:uncharacterized protein (TIGR02265 family)